MPLPFTQYLLAPQYLPWLWLLAGLVALYLIRPKPVNQMIPSLMFLLQDKGRSLKYSFLRYLLRDFVFLLQLLILALLVLAAAQPFIEVSKTSLVGNSVVVIDASASMQTRDGRWQDAMREAGAALAGQNTIILAKNRPVIYEESVGRADAQRSLDELQPSDTETNLYGAIIASREFAPDADTVVTVISDFRETDEQQDWRAAVRAVQASGATVRLVPVGTQEAANVGITSVSVAEDRTTIGITSYLPEATVVELAAGSTTQSVPLPAGGSDFVTITTPPGITTVSIDADDDFPLDDEAVIANNPDLSMRVLIITNDDDVRRTPLWFALQAINDQTPLSVTVDVNTPPAIVANTDDYDLFVFMDVDQGLLVQRTVRDVADRVRAGEAAAVITHQDSLFSIDFEGMLPLQYESEGGASAVVTGELSSVTAEITFGSVTTHTEVSGNARVLATAAADGGILAAIIPVGQGLVLYYGIPDEAATFPNNPKYVVFWKRVLDELDGRVSIDALNAPTGSQPLGVRGAPQRSPSGERYAYAGFLDDAGVYEWPDRAIAATLASSRESDVAAAAVDDIISLGGSGRASDATKEKELASLLVLLALVVLGLELFFVKFRGDF